MTALVEGAYTNAIVAIQTQAVIANSVAMVVVLPVPSARPVRIRAIVLAARLVTTVQRALTSLLVVKISAMTAHLALTRLLEVLLHVVDVRPAQPLRKARRLVTHFPATRAHTAVQVVANTALLERTPITELRNALRVHLVPSAAAVSRTATRARLVNISRTVDTLIASIARQAKLLPLALQVVTHSTVMPACMLPLVVATTALQACTIPP